MDKYGAKNVYEIGSIYAADSAWASKVTNYINRIDDFSQVESTNTLSISI